MGMPLAHLGLGPVQSRLDAIRRQMAESSGATSVLQEAVEALSALIEELRAAEGSPSEGQALAAAERARYYEFFELAPDAYVITDTNGAITEANSVASHVLRTPADRLLGEPLAAFVAPSDESLFGARLAALQQSHTRNPIEWQLWLRPPGSSPFPVSVTVSAIVGNQPPQIRWLLRDITARHYAERAAVESLRVAQDAYERERRITARFQNALLPRSDLLIPGCILAHSYRPALAEAEVGGDFYNFFPVDARRTALVVGDVGGKGLAAAAMAAFAQHTIVALAMQRGMLPTLLDAARPVIAAFDPDQIVTVFFATLRTDTGSLRWTSAGHESPLLWRAAEKRVDTLESRGAAIFGLPAVPYAAQRTVLAPGDLFFLYTDGLREAGAPRPDDMLGEERIAEILTRYHAAHPAEVIQAMYDAALHQSRGDIRDDIVLMALRRADTPYDAETLRVEPPQMARRQSLPAP